MHAALALVLAAACGTGDGPTASAPASAGIRAVATPATTDTALAIASQALVVEVRGADGAPAAGAAVQFAVRLTADPRRRTESALYVCRAAAATCGPAAAPADSAAAGGPTSVVDTTDGSGRARVRVRFGTIAGPAYVVLIAPGVGLRDSVPFTVLAGAAVAVRWPARDVSVVLGSTRGVAAAVVDAHGNARTETPAYTFAGSAGVAAFDAASGTVTARDLGTAAVVASFAAFADTATVRAVPPGRLVVADIFSQALRLVNTDGTGLRTLATDAYSLDGLYPNFTPDGRHVAYQAHVPTMTSLVPQQLVVLDTAGGTPRTIPAPEDVLSVGYARPGDDGAVFFVGQQASTLRPALYRAAPDGRVTARATLPTTATEEDAYDVAPDGVRVAYITGGGPYGTTTGLYVLDVASGTTTRIDAAGYAPRWSRDGTRLAFLVVAPSGSGALVVTNPDGTGRTTFGPTVYYRGLAWSPDGTYVLGKAGSSNHLRVVRVRDGASVDLALPDVYEPDWH